MTKTYFEFQVLAQKITAFKKENKLTYEQIGNALGVNRSHIHRIINMETFPSLKFVIRLAGFMKLPLYTLFIPSEEMCRKKLTDEVNNRLRELDWNPDKLEEKTKIPLLHLLDILHGDSSPTVEEHKTLINILELEEGINYQEVKLDIIKSLLSDLEVESSNIDSVLQYVKDNII
ncbi:MAG: helix-turn-helix transcriptional regulator [Halanaerobiales bacterium]|nr:helix-turn-helix transcriptional regulator [Halanaerobiales bacterium]